MNANFSKLVSTGTPGGLRKHSSHHLICQFPRRPLDYLPGVLRLGIHFSPGLTHPGPGGLPCHIERGFTLGGALLVSCLAHFEDLRARLAKFLGILSRPGFGPGDCFMGILDSALGTGATLCKCATQWPLHQKLVCQDQATKSRMCVASTALRFVERSLPCLYRLTRADRVFPSQVSPFLMGLQPFITGLARPPLERQPSRILFRNTIGKGLGTPFCIRDKPPSQRCEALCGRVL